MTVQEMKARIVKDYPAFKEFVRLQKIGYDEATAVVWVYRVWFEKLGR